MTLVVRLFFMVLCVFAASSCTNAIPVTDLNSSDKPSAYHVNQQISSAGGEISGATYKIKFRMGDTSSDDVIGGNNYQIRAKGIR